MNAAARAASDAATRTVRLDLMMLSARPRCSLPRAKCFDSVLDIPGAPTVKVRLSDRVLDRRLPACTEKREVLAHANTGKKRVVATPLSHRARCDPFQKSMVRSRDARPVYGHSVQSRTLYPTLGREMPS